MGEGFFQVVVCIYSFWEEKVRRVHCFEWTSVERLSFFIFLLLVVGGRPLNGFLSWNSGAGGGGEEKGKRHFCIWKPM